MGHSREAVPGNRSQLRATGFSFWISLSDMRTPTLRAGDEGGQHMLPALHCKKIAGEKSPAHLLFGSVIAEVGF